MVKWTLQYSGKSSRSNRGLSPNVWVCVDSGACELKGNPVRRKQSGCASCTSHLAASEDGSHPDLASSAQPGLVGSQLSRISPDQCFDGRPHRRPRVHGGGQRQTPPPNSSCLGNPAGLLEVSCDVAAISVATGTIHTRHPQTGNKCSKELQQTARALNSISELIDQSPLG